MPALDLTPVVSLIADQAEAIIAVGGAALMLLTTLQGIRWLKAQLGAGSTFNQGARDNASRALAEIEAVNAGEGRFYTLEVNGESRTVFIANDDRSEDRADEAALRASLSGDVLARRERDFDEFGSRRGD